MKKFYNFLAIVFLSILSHNVHSQSPGDIAFTAINVDGDEDFAFVLLTNLSSGTEIYFTRDTILTRLKLKAHCLEYPERSSVCQQKNGV